MNEDFPPLLSLGTYPASNPEQKADGSSQRTPFGVSLRVCEERDHSLQWFLFFFFKLSIPSVSYQAVILPFSCFPHCTPQAPPLRMNHPLQQQQGLGIPSKHIQEGDPSQRFPLDRMFQQPQHC